MLAEDPRGPGKFGFDEWVSVTNFFDVSPLMSDNGSVKEFAGDSSEIAVAEATRFIEKHHSGGKPLFVVIWFGSPHSPFRALPQDRSLFPGLNEASASHYGELAAMDRSVTALRKSLRDYSIAKNTLLVFCSDNGGLPEVKPDSVGGLRGYKSSVFEGGLRVPGIIEWPSVITVPRITNYPACTMDLFPTIADVLNLPATVMLQPIDGMSLKPLLMAEIDRRSKSIPFRFGSKSALIDNQYKILTNDLRKGTFQLYDLQADPAETTDLGSERPELFARLKQELLAWNESVDASFSGKDYPEGIVNPPDPESIFWYDSPLYQKYLADWKDRWEFKTYMERQPGKGAAKKKQARAAD